MSGPFDLAAHFKLEPVSPSYEDLLKLFEKKYGIRDAARFYELHRRYLIQHRMPDPWCVTKHQSLSKWFMWRRSYIQQSRGKR